MSVHEKNNKLKRCKCGATPEVEEIPVGLFINKGVRYTVKCYKCNRSYGFWLKESDAIWDWNKKT